jgi:dTDP-4-amino-4,6-dideoxygalactose transaminase
MIAIEQYANPFQAILDFEHALCDFTGAPYCVTTDCCTHAIEIAFRLKYKKQTVQFPAKTYISVIMTMHQLDVDFRLIDRDWRGGYQFENSEIWDCARMLETNQYQAGTIQCLSFGITKPLAIGRGGCLLTDDVEVYQRASRMRSDGRDLFAFSPWQKQTSWEIGFHYWMRPEECVRGLNMLQSGHFTPQTDNLYTYPDCRQIEIKI